MPPTSFAIPPLDCWTLQNKVLWFFKNIQTTSPVTQHYIPEDLILQQWKMFMNILPSFQIAHTVYAYFALLKQMHST
jgi:hypothetical protein